MKTNIYCDLDNTLIDIWVRLHAVFCHVTGDNSLKLDEYKAMKRSGRTQHNILANDYGLSEQEMREIKKLWDDRIESTQFLMMDELYSGAKESLEYISGKASIHMITRRRNMKKLFDQLEAFGITSLFDSIISVSDNQTKHMVIRSINSYGIDAGYMFQIDDTLQELNFTDPGILKIGLTTGYYNNSSLEALPPPILIAESFSNAISLIDRRIEQC
jgi:phosphoglycolate phosphatase-like HAD superfamily hydrolase